MENTAQKGNPNKIYREQSHPKKLAVGTMVQKSVLLFCFILLSSTYVMAQKGPFLRFSLGPGFMNEYSTQSNVNFHLSGAYGTVHFSDNWKKQGDFIEDGYAVALGIDKNWSLSERIDLGVGPHTFFLKTKNYAFTNFSLNFWLDFYLFPQR